MVFSPLEAYFCSYTCKLNVQLYHSCSTLQLCDDSLLSCVFLHSNSRTVAAFLGAYGQDPEELLQQVTIPWHSYLQIQMLGQIQKLYQMWALVLPIVFAKSFDPQFRILSSHTASCLMKFQSYSIQTDGEALLHMLRLTLHHGGFLCWNNTSGQSQMAWNHDALWQGPQCLWSSPLSVSWGTKSCR